MTTIRAAAAAVLLAKAAQRARLAKLAEPARLEPAKLVQSRHPKAALLVPRLFPVAKVVRLASRRSPKAARLALTPPVALAGPDSPSLFG